MEATNQDPVGTQDQEKVAGGAPEQINQDSVKYETYQKLLGEKKNRDKQLEEMRDRVKAFEQGELEKKGQYETLINSLKEENKKLRDGMTQRDEAYFMSRVKSAVTTKAIEAGCKAPDKLLKLIDSSRIRNLTVDDDFNVDSKEVEFLINEAKKENDFLFKKSHANVADGNPVEQPVVAPGKKLSEMTDKELMELHKKTYKK